MVHEAGELQGIVYAQEKVVVVGEEDKGMDLDGMESLSSGEDPDDNGLQVVARSEEEATLNCPTGHFDQGSTFWDIP